MNSAFDVNCTRINASRLTRSWSWSTAMAEEADNATSPVPSDKVRNFKVVRWRRWRTAINEAISALTTPIWPLFRKEVNWNQGPIACEVTPGTMTQGESVGVNNERGKRRRDCFE